MSRIRSLSIHDRRRSRKVVTRRSSREDKSDPRPRRPLALLDEVRIVQVNHGGREVVLGSHPVDVSTTWGRS